MKFNRRFSQLNSQFGRLNMTFQSFELNKYIEQINYISFFNHNSGNGLDFLFTTEEPFTDLKLQHPVKFAKEFYDGIGDEDGTE